MAILTVKWKNKIDTIPYPYILLNTDLCRSANTIILMKNAKYNKRTIVTPKIRLPPQWYKI